ncbi:Uncharacterised protein [Mycobacterium tuberculosis]|nr:Uncharacterised protein [Mycobacterium tuberculosis]
MAVMEQILRLVGLTDPPQPAGVLISGWPPAATMPREQQRKLADTMRHLPGRFQDRLPPAVLQRITGAAAAGQWEKAIDHLVMALYMRHAPVTPAERAELRGALRALGIPTRRVDTLPPR